jgi:hypothetical protein
VAGTVGGQARIVDETLRQQDGVVARWQALQWMTAETLLHRVRSGRWQRVHRGIYLAHSGAVTDRQRRWIAALAAGGGRPAAGVGTPAIGGTPSAAGGSMAALAVVSGRVGALAGTTALEAAGLRGYGSATVHVLIPADWAARNSPSNSVIHRTRHLRPSDLRRGRPPRTTPARSVVDAA